MLEGIQDHTERLQYNREEVIDSHIKMERTTIIIRKKNKSRIKRGVLEEEYEKQQHEHKKKERRSKLTGEE